MGAAAQGHPALKAIFPYDRLQCILRHVRLSATSTRAASSNFPLYLDVFSTVHEHRDRPWHLPARRRGGSCSRRNGESRFQVYANLYNHSDANGERKSALIMYARWSLPGSPMGTVEASEEETFKEDQDTFLRDRSYGLYLQTTPGWRAALLQNVKARLSSIFHRPAHLERPFN